MASTFTESDPGSLSLSGIRVAITRATHQVAEQRQLLERLGAIVYHYPTIAIVPPIDLAPLDQALENVRNGLYDWLILTSTNTVFALADRIQTLNMPLDVLAPLNVAVVGTTTKAAAIQQLGVQVDVVPDSYTTESLAQTLNLTAGTRVLLPQSAIAKPTIQNSLEQQDVVVNTVEAYRTVVATGGDDVPGLLWEGQIDAITFTSASSVRYFYKRLTMEGGTMDMLDDVVVASIGPVTAEAVQAYGVRVSIVPSVHTIDGLTQGLVRYFQ
ncbi:uroporphyrinogen-III synthase [Chloroflexi bacterium TSY]|nr:uroporphyrinogen-III synthase [Chloroflexi bacterium TSY]